MKAVDTEFLEDIPHAYGLDSLHADVGTEGPCGINEVIDQLPLLIILLNLLNKAAVDLDRIEWQVLKESHR